MLSISADNARFSDIMDQVRKCTGAKIDVPADVDEPVAVRLGPGPAAQVIAALLQGMHLNYLIVGAAHDPGVVASVLLTPIPAALPESAPVRTPDREAAVESARAAAKANLTGGDEGVWDDVDAGTLVVAPAAPVAPAAAPAPK
jgi:hypothetical protein